MTLAYIYKCIPIRVCRSTEDWSEKTDPTQAPQLYQESNALCRMRASVRTRLLNQCCPRSIYNVYRKRLRIVLALTKPKVEMTSRSHIVMAFFSQIRTSYLKT